MYNYERLDQFTFLKEESIEVQKMFHMLLYTY